MLITVCYVLSMDTKKEFDGAEKTNPGKRLHTVEFLKPLVSDWDVDPETASRWWLQGMDVQD